MKKIRVTWYEETLYEQTFLVEDDFDPADSADEEGGALIDLITEGADYGCTDTENSQISVSVDEREVHFWKWVVSA